MARYLTPVKIALLTISSLYCEGAVPTSSNISVLSFVVSNLQISNSLAAQGSDLVISPDPTESVQKFEAILQKIESNIPGRTLYDSFLSKLWDINSLDALHVFFSNLENLLAKNAAEARRDAQNGEDVSPDEIRLSRSSPLGTFVRRAQLEFTRLQFHDSMRLWTAFIRYRNLTANAWKMRSHSLSLASLDENLEGLDEEGTTSLFKLAYPDFESDEQEVGMNSSSDIERLLEFQVDKLQRKYYL